MRPKPPGKPSRLSGAPAARLPFSFPASPDAAVTGSRGPPAGVRDVGPFVDDDEPEDDSRDDVAPVDPELEAERQRISLRRKRATVVALVLGTVLVALALALDGALDAQPPGMRGLVPLDDAPSAVHLDEATGAEAPAGDEPSAPDTDGRRASQKVIAADDVAAGTAPPGGRGARGGLRPRQPPPAAADAPSVARETAKVTREPANAVAREPASAVDPGARAVAAATKAAPAAAISATVVPQPIAGDVASAKAEIPETLVVVGVDEPIYETLEPAPAVPLEELRPRRPWPKPTGPAPEGGGVGRLSLISLPRASVTLNGIPIGSTPLEAQELPSGRLRLVLTGPDDVPRVFTVDVVAGSERKLQLPLSRLMPAALDSP